KARSCAPCMRAELDPFRLPLPDGSSDLRPFGNLAAVAALATAAALWSTARVCADAGVWFSAMTIASTLALRISWVRRLVAGRLIERFSICFAPLIYRLSAAWLGGC